MREKSYIFVQNAIVEPNCSSPLTKKQKKPPYKNYLNNILSKTIKSFDFVIKIK